MYFFTEFTDVINADNISRQTFAIYSLLSQIIAHFTKNAPNLTEIVGGWESPDPTEGVTVLPRPLSWV